MLDFPGIGRVIEREADDDDDDDEEIDEDEIQAQQKQIDSPTLLRLTGELDALSTGRDLSGRCLSDAETHLSPDGVSPDEAQLICKSVLSELLAERATVQPYLEPRARTAASSAMTPRETTAITPRPSTDEVDSANVTVAACDRGCFSGNLEWVGKSPASSSKTEKVIFTLLEIRQGYTVVGDMIEGPKLLSSVCWKLQSVNGHTDARPAWIRRGDVLLLEGPRWATKRLLEPLPPLQNNRFASPVKPPLEEPMAPLSVSHSSSLSSRSMSAVPTGDDAVAPPLLTSSTQPRSANPSRTDRYVPIASPEALGAASPVPQRPVAQESSISKSIDFEVVHVSSPSTSAPSMAPERSDTRLSAKDRDGTLISEVSGTASNCSNPPVIPVLNLKVVDKRREALLQKKAGKQLPPGVCESFEGCDFAGYECAMLPPSKHQEGRKPTNARWQCM